jgi:hypothetical protein
MFFEEPSFEHPPHPPNSPNPKVITQKTKDGFFMSPFLYRLFTATETQTPVVGCCATLLIVVGKLSLACAAGRIVL